MAKRLNDYSCKECENVEERYWDVDLPENPKCTKCGGETVRHLAAPTISYSGDKTFRQRVPSGFKDVLKTIDKGTPKHHKGAKFSAL